MADSINLLLPPSKEEIQKVKIKSGVDLSSVIGIFIFVLFGLIVLIFSLYYNSKVKKYQEEKQNLINQITRYEDPTDLEGERTSYKVGTTQRLINDKWRAYKTIGRHTVTNFIDKIKLFESLIPSQCQVHGYNFANDNSYTFSGQCKDYEYILDLSDSVNTQDEHIKTGMISHVSKVDEDEEEEIEYKYQFSINGSFVSKESEN
jgi:preprotein translocase subunit YajC